MQMFRYMTQEEARKEIERREAEKKASPDRAPEAGPEGNSSCHFRRKRSSDNPDKSPRRSDSPRRRNR